MKLDMHDWLFVCALLVGYGLDAWRGVATAALLIGGYIVHGMYTAPSFEEKADAAVERAKKDVQQLWDERERMFNVMQENAENGK